MDTEGINFNPEFVSAGFTADEVATAAGRLSSLLSNDGGRWGMAQQETLEQSNDALRAAAERVKEIAAQLEEPVAALVDALTEWARAAAAVIRRIAEAIAAIVEAAALKTGWMLTTAGLEGWWGSYATFARVRLRKRADRWRRLRRPASWLLDRLPDRVIVVLFREVYLRYVRLF